jgi:hypothetical protein
MTTFRRTIFEMPLASRAKFADEARIILTCFADLMERGSEQMVG